MSSWWPNKHNKAFIKISMSLRYGHMQACSSACVWWGAAKTKRQGSFQVVYRLWMCPIITQIKCGFQRWKWLLSDITLWPFSDSGFPQPLLMSSGVSQFLLSKAWSRLTPSFISVDCEEKLSERSVCIRLHLSQFLGCICNQIFEPLTSHEDDLTAFLISCPS